MCITVEVIQPQECITLTDVMTLEENIQAEPINSVMSLPEEQLFLKEALHNKAELIGILHDELLALKIEIIIALVQNLKEMQTQIGLVQNLKEIQTQVE